jgi:hypothetical protein
VQADDGKKFRDVLRGMGRMYGQEPDNLVLDAYWIALREWSYPEFEAAAARLMLTAKFMPRPADFNELRKASNDTAAECWARALTHAAALSTCGGYLQEEPSGDERLDAVVRTIGGYKAMANASPRDLQFMAQRFAENFESVTGAEETRAALPQLTGGPRLAGPRSTAELLTHVKPS